jgi:hypothetical protein
MSSNRQAAFDDAFIERIAKAGIFPVREIL